MNLIDLDAIDSVFCSYFQVIFPTGVKVDIVRNYWGIDITILTNRPNSPNMESGICLYSRLQGDVNAYGERQRYVETKDQVNNGLTD